MKVRELFSAWKELFSAWKCVNFSLHERNFLCMKVRELFSTWKKLFLAWKCVKFSLHERNFSLHESAWTFLYMKENFLCMKVRELFSTWKKLFFAWKCVNLKITLLHYNISSVWFAIKDNTCLIMPTISPFGLDGKNTKSLSPFDIKGKGQTKIFSSFADHTPPKCLLKYLNELPLYICQGVPIYPCSPWVHDESLHCWSVLFMLPLTVGKIYKKMFFKKNDDLYIIKDLPTTKRLNIYIHHPTKWGYIRNLHMTTKYITSSSQV